MYRHVCTSWLTFSSSPDDVRTATVYCRVQGRSRPTMRVGELSYKDGPGRQCVSVPSFQLIELFATCYLPTRAIYRLVRSTALMIGRCLFTSHDVLAVIKTCLIINKNRKKMLNNRENIVIIRTKSGYMMATRISNRISYKANC